jgi:aspartokinase
MAKLLGVFQEMNILPETYTFSETRISFCLPSKYVQEIATNIHNVLII